MALKEFLILTQQDELSEHFRDAEITAASYFTAPTNAISNLSILVQELTRENPLSRMTIQQFQELLNHRNVSTENFYKQLEIVFPAQSLRY